MARPIRGIDVFAFLDLLVPDQRDVWKVWKQRIADRIVHDTDISFAPRIPTFSVTIISGCSKTFSTRHSLEMRSISPPNDRQWMVISARIILFACDPTFCSPFHFDYRLLSLRSIIVYIAHVVCFGRFLFLLLAVLAICFEPLLSESQ
ncbi:hypothetical protein V8E55_002810 [Tylopilus felleus]